MGRPTPPIDPKTFWDAKILGWEDSRYQASAAAPTWLERIAGSVSTSLRFRQETALALLAPHVPGRRLVELGCGSGRLAERLMALGAAAYHGIDVSPVAIARAHERVADSAQARRIRFEVGGVAELPAQGDALVFSLGLFDWLSDAEIGHVLTIGRGGAYFHAVAERQRSIQQAIHQLYVHLSYGRRCDYVPRYHALAEIAAALDRCGLPPCRVYRHPKMRFGIFVSDLPLPGA